eukprot:scaffold1736_cov127-Cylindrotheca_fusiformis.AAC.71
MNDLLYVGDVACVEDSPSSLPHFISTVNSESRESRQADDARAKQPMPNKTTKRAKGFANKDETTRRIVVIAKVFGLLSLSGNKRIEEHHLGC